MSEPYTAHITEQAWISIAPGFQTRDEVVEGIRDLAEDYPDQGVTADAAEEIVHALWARREEYLATEPARRPTDDARVADAFAALGRDGLVAEMNCGFDQDEASEECKALARQNGLGGYVFFHMQDTEGLAHPSAALYLGFDAVPVGRERFDSRAEYDEAAVAVGHRIAQALVARGLDVRWNATATARIEIVGLDWRRPLPYE